MSEQLFVTTEWLAEHLHDANLRVIDIRGRVIPASEPTPHYFSHHADYVQSHIPGAVFVDWVEEITDPADPRHAQIAKPQRFAAVASRLGIGPETQVIAYDDANGMFAARIWWALNYYGHTKVAVLDGGWQKWLAEGHPVTADVPEVTATDFQAKAQPALYRSRDDVLSLLNTDTTLIDVRTPKEFAGEAARATRKGHIPGAVNQPRDTLLASDGTLLPAHQLREKFTALGLKDADAPVVTYCNGGVSASYGLMALRAAGYTNAAVYDGSWKDWGNRPDTPIESDVEDAE